MKVDEKWTTEEPTHACQACARTEARARRRCPCHGTTAQSGWVQVCMRSLSHTHTHTHVLMHAQLSFRPLWSLVYWPSLPSGPRFLGSGSHLGTNQKMVHLNKSSSGSQAAALAYIKNWTLSLVYEIGCLPGKHVRDNSFIPCITMQTNKATSAKSSQRMAFCTAPMSNIGGASAVNVEAFLKIASGTCAFIDTMSFQSELQCAPG